MTIVLDAGGLLAIERGDRSMIALLKREALAGREPRTHGGVLAQVWRGGHGRQALLARLVPALDVVPIDRALGARAGLLLGASRTSDAIDAALVLIAADGDEIFTSDPGDLLRLAEAAAIHVDVVRT